MATYVQDWGDAGVTNFTAAWNWTETEVDAIGIEVGRDRLVELEEFNPKNRGIFTANHTMGDWRFLLRASYYDDWVEASTGGPVFTPGSTDYEIVCSDDGSADNCYDGDWIFDAEIEYAFQGRYRFILGGQNIFDEKGPKDLDNTAPEGFSNSSGTKYETSTPWGFQGGFYYLRFVADLNY